MQEFHPGDRVRVRDLTALGSFADRSGTVVGVEPDDATGAVLLCQGRLDGAPAKFAVPFLVEELEPELAPGGDSR